MTSQAETAVPSVTVAVIEEAINIWRNRSPAPATADGMLVLCEQARVLADVYALMIVARKPAWPLKALSKEQHAALTEAFASP